MPNNMVQVVRVPRTFPCREAIEREGRNLRRTIARYDCLGMYMFLIIQITCFCCLTALLLINAIFVFLLLQ
jgi:hypothetical protein